MEQIILKFTANGQVLASGNCPYHFASDTVGYIGAEFTLDDVWQSLDTVKAVWYSEHKTITKLLDSDGACEVPPEVLTKMGLVKVNLVGSTSEDDEVTERLTSYPFPAIVVDKKVRLKGSETKPITTSQYEQFVAQVQGYASNASDSAGAAADSAEAAAASASLAEQAAENAGYMFFSIDANGHLIYERTDNTEVDFYLSNGNLFVEASE